MKIKYLIPMAAFALPLIAGAVPAKPGVHQMVNPDGSKVKVQCFGDEHFSYYTDAQGKKLYELDAKGFMIPMVREGKIMEASVENIETLRAEMIKEEPSGRKRMAALDSEGRTTFPSKGKQRGLVILVEFADRPFHFTKQNFEKLLMEPGYSDFNALGSCSDYYKATSDNMFDPQFDVYGPVKLSREAGYYTGIDKIGTDNRAGKYLRMSDLIYEALTALDKDIDFKLYDGDNDGTVDNVFFFFAGHGQADYYGNEYDKRTCIWPHAGTYYSTMKPLTLDGKRIAPYACSMELDGGLSSVDNRWLTGIGTFCHEFGHVLGLPDLYDAQGGSTKVPGAFDTMSSASYNLNSTCPVLFSSYERWLCGWLEYTDLEDGKSYELAPLATPLKESEFGKPDQRMRRLRLKAPFGMVYPNEYFLMENRTKQGFDRSIPQEGMLFWHINYVANAWRSNSVNSYNRPYVLPIGPSGAYTAWTGEDLNYQTPEENRIVELCYNEVVFNDYITNILYNTETKKVSFDYNILKETPTLKTRILDVKRPDQSKRAFVINWEELPEADYYTVTVYYKNEEGSTVYVDGCKEKNVGKETQLTVQNMTATQFKREMHAYVRCTKVIPSKEISNEFVFTPNNLSSVGVDEITTDSEIFAGNGYIVAPENAQVYNMAGVRVGKENLPAGIYVVRAGKKAVKVVVK